MAPEVVMGRKYDTRADVWSLGITLLGMLTESISIVLETKLISVTELAHGCAPGSKDKVANILRHTVQDAPPSLDRSTGNYSRSFKEFIDSSLQKDPDQR
jgi:serine/threonine-protein kinase OSR1/STK39